MTYMRWVFNKCRLNERINELVNVSKIVSDPDPIEYSQKLANG